VIRLTRLSNQPITVNSDLIKFIESNPDTVITLLSGDKLLVQETETEVVARVIEFRRAVVGGLPSVADPGTAAATCADAQRGHDMLLHLEGKPRG
jgi:flagellar protein FlbD